MRQRVTRALRRLPLRLKLTLAFSGVMALMLAAIGVFVYLHFVSGLDASINQGLRTRANQITSLIHSPGHVPVGRLPLGGSTQNVAQILNARGRVVDASAGMDQPLLRPEEIARAERTPVLVERHERTRLFATAGGGGTLIVVVGESLAEHEHAIETLGGALLIGGPLALLLASLAAYGLTAAALAPVESMRRRAATISAGNLNAKLPLPDSVDEIYRLGSTLNEMLARLEQAFEHERAFIADASHELRMPLTVLKAELEVTLKQTGTGPAREALVSAVEEADRVIELAEDLLMLAGADRARLVLELRPLDIAGLLDAAKDRYSQSTNRGDRRVIIDPAAGGIVRADPARLQQALVNLLDNALRYGRGTISLTAHPRGHWIEVHVTDEGPGFPPEFLETAFERFTRADRARGRGGTGLGLAIVDAIARAHGGDAHAANRAGGGADVWLTLPAADTDATDGRRPAALQTSAG